MLMKLAMMKNQGRQLVLIDDVLRQLASVLRHQADLEEKIRTKPEKAPEKAPEKKWRSLAEGMYDNGDG